MTDNKEDQEGIGFDFGNRLTYAIVAAFQASHQFITHAIGEAREGSAFAFHAERFTQEFRRELEQGSGPNERAMVVPSDVRVSYLDQAFTQKTKSLADIKYPHKCYKCGKDLFWWELLDANLYKDRAHLIKLWQSKYVQFYCCNCYDLKHNE